MIRLCLLCTKHGLIVRLVQQVDWKAEENRPVTPRLLGTQVYKEYDVKDVVDYIDWNPFFQVSTPSLGLLLCGSSCNCLS